AVWGEGDAKGLPFMAQFAQLLAGTRIPQTNALFATCRGQRLAIGGKGETDNVLLFLSPPCPPRNDVFQFKVAVELGGYRLAVGRERAVRQAPGLQAGASLAFEFVQPFTCCRFQEKKSAAPISASGSQDAAVGGQSGTKDLTKIDGGELA